MDQLRNGVDEFHGYQIARAIADRERAKLLLAYGTLYKALERLDEAGLVASRWEPPHVAAKQKRPRRRLYHVTAMGERAYYQSPATLAGNGRRLIPDEAL